MSDQEKTPSGDPIYRYDMDKMGEFDPTTGDMDNIEVISDHIETHIGTVEGVFHELVSDKVHIDIHWVKPTPRFPFHTLVTSGMSDKPMNVPEGLEEVQYAELCILLPSHWQLDLDNEKMTEIFEDEKNYWPIRWLKIVAKLPHDFNSWIGWGHTVPNGEQADAFADNTKLGCMLLLPAINLPEEFYQLTLEDGKTITFYALYPLYKEEMDFKLHYGTEALLQKFDEYQVPTVIDVHRPNTCVED